MHGEHVHIFANQKDKDKISLFLQLLTDKEQNLLRVLETLIMGHISSWIK